MDRTRARVEETREWAVQVATAFVEHIRSLHRGEFTPIQIDDCWVGADLALYIRYRRHRPGRGSTRSTSRRAPPR